LPETIHAETGMGAMGGCDVVLMVAPTQFVRSVCAGLKDAVPDHVPVVICAKGSEQSSLKLPAEIVADVLPENPLAILSGPSFAADVARGLPTAVTLAIGDQAVGHRIVQALGRTTFRIYLSDDLVGAQIGGATKNVLAIACGIVAGRGLGDSARAALIARGFAEMQRLALPLGAKAQTLAGLSGLGDLILTCNGVQSRNMSLGMALGQGQKMAEILAQKKSVAEGVYTADAVTRLAKRHGIDMPICCAVRDIVQERTTVDEAIEDLLNRPLVPES